MPVTQAWVEWRLKDEAWVAKARQRLQSLSWFMKCLKEPLSRMVNRRENTRGAFFESRFKSIAILDEEALLATCVYIDLNPVAAGIAAVPEQNEHTSFKQRVDHVRSRSDEPQSTAQGDVTPRAVAGLEDALWLCPVEDRRQLDSPREGMLAGFTLASYMQLVDYTGRMFRHGKAVISAPNLRSKDINDSVAGIFERLGSSADAWQARLTKLSGGRLLGRFFAATRDRLRQAAAHWGVHQWH